MKALRIVVGLLALAASIAMGVRSCSAATAAIGGTIPTADGAALFTAATFLFAGFLLGGGVLLLWRNKNGSAFVAAFLLLFADLLVAGGGIAAAGSSLWAWLGGAFAVLLFGSGIAGLVRERKS